jgi:hypothetical protein
VECSGHRWNAASNAAAGARRGREVQICAPVSYEEAARILGVGVPNVTSLIHRLRQRHTQLLREEVERTVLDPAEVHAELHGRCEALVQAEGRVRA